MPARADSFDLARLRLAPGEGRRVALHATHEPFLLSSQRYRVDGGDVPLTLDVARMTGVGYSLRLRFEVQVTGPCMRCLEPARPALAVDVREVHRPAGGSELDSPYVEEDVLDLRAWVRDALALALPAQILCREACAGLCPACGANLNESPGHAHEPALDPRWAPLRDLL